MWAFLICGTLLLLYAYKRFRLSGIFYPSVVFSFMWGGACVMTGLILSGVFNNLYLADYYNYRYIDKYILWFTGASIVAFSLAHNKHSDDEVDLQFNTDFLSALVEKYKWILWLNFFGGILRIILMLQIVGFDNIMDYRIAANTMMNTGMGTVGLVFRITSYIQMLANFYVAMCGFLAGFEKLNLKDTLILFVLYSPTQMATGGRLFVLYFILFYIGSFLLGRGIVLKQKEQSFFESSEKKALSIVTIGFLSIISLIAMIRQLSYSTDSSNIKGESPIAKFTYISEGILESEHYMRFYTPNEITIDYGRHFLTGRSNYYLRYRGHLQLTDMSSIVMSVITPLYTGFGFYGSIVVWFIIAYSLETIGIYCLERLTVIRFLIFMTILKIMYESVISNSIQGNIPVYELIVLFVVFYKPIFGKLEDDSCI